MYINCFRIIPLGQRSKSTMSTVTGPTKKRPGYDLAKLSTLSLGRSHRSAYSQGRLQYAIDLTKTILEVRY